MRSGGKQAVRYALAALMASLCLAGTSAAPLRAQMLVIPVQDLQFGQLTPGVPATVSAADVARRAEFTLQAPKGTYSVTFQLPAQLTLPTGQSIPLIFTGTDGQLSIRNRAEFFDPAVGTTVKLTPADTEASIYLGATARPAPGQLAGAYRATIVVVIVNTGT